MWFYLSDLQLGAGNESRTRDLNLGKVALYQLSYSRVKLGVLLVLQIDGAGNESRTRDLNLGKVALYQLSYSRVKLGVLLALQIDGAGNESRTRDLNLGKVALYQLSYSRISNLLLLKSLERETSLELATSTLARLRSTN